MDISGPITDSNAECARDNRPFMTVMQAALPRGNG